MVAQSVQETAWAEATVVDGQDSVQLEDGVQVTVSGQALDGLTLVVYQIPRSDEQAWAWMESCMEKYGTNLYPLDLSFMDSQGDRVEVQSVITVTVTYTGDYQAPAVFYLVRAELSQRWNLRHRARLLHLPPITTAIMCWQRQKRDIRL